MTEATQSATVDQSAAPARLVALPRASGVAGDRHNLPAGLSSFIGRDRELTEITRLLAESRLLTLTGAGGAGKTRMAVEAAAELVGAFEDGPWLVELATLEDPSLVPQMLAATLGVREQPGLPVTAALVTSLRSREVLLVLDNCEHLIDACAELVGALLHACPALRVLATSREALGLTGEVVWPVPPMTVPAQRRTPDIEDLYRYESIKLFTERANAVAPPFTVTRENAAAVVAIAGQLEGIPLAIELAAARTKVLSVQEISVRLDDCFRLLVAGERTAATRHRTLQATIDWSYDLLSTEEQILFTRVAVFAGGFTLRAAEAVAADPQLDVGEVLPLLAQLVDKSLVMTQELAGQTRYRMLATVRQYAIRKLPSADTERVERRHSDFYLALAEEAEHGLVGPEHRTWLLRLGLELDNLRAVMDRSLREPDDAEAGARIASALWVFWFARGHLSEGCQWLLSTAEVTGPQPSRARAKSLNAVVMLAIHREEYDAAKTYGEQAVALYRELGDHDGLASSLAALGLVGILGLRDDIPMQALLAEALALRPRLTDWRVIGQLLDLEGGLAIAVGHEERARRLWQEHLELCENAADSYGVATCVTNLGLLAVRTRDAERAESLLRRGFELALELDFKLLIQYCLVGRGSLAASGGQLVQAARLWGAAEALGEEYGINLTRATRSMIDYDARVAGARRRFDETAWAAAWTDGRVLSPERAIEPSAEVEMAEDPPVLPGGLTVREVDVLRFVASGSTNAEVARALFLSSRTVEWHLNSIFTKLGFHSRTEAARYAVAQGLV